MTFETRRIFKSAVTSQNLVRELLQFILLGEILAPGERRLWLVSPWISNVVLFDNRAGGFNAVNPEWIAGEVRLVQVLADLMSRGAPVGVATSLDAHNDAFIARLEEAALEVGVSDKLDLVRRPSLHTKGLLAQRGLLSGSMNLTYNGLELNDEMVVYDTTPRALAEARLNFDSYLGPGA